MSAIERLRAGMTSFCDRQEKVVNYERGGYSYSEHRDDCRKCAAKDARWLLWTPPTTRWANDRP